MRMLSPRKYTLKDNEQGFASIVIVIVLILVLSLLTVGFAQLARREQQTALDKQLAAQAQYAAESGINDAYKDIQNGVLTATNTSSNTCMKPTSQGGQIPTGAQTYNQTINSTDDVAYTCLLVNLSPPVLQYNLGDGTQSYASFSVSAPLSSLTIKWGSTDGKTTFPTSIPANSTQFLPHDQWTADNYPPLIQFSITPLDSAANMTRSAMIGNTFTAYLYPTSASSSAYTYSYGIGNANGDGTSTGDTPVIAGNCAGSGATTCLATINGFSTAGPYLIRIVSYYDSGLVVVNGINTSGTTETFVNGQATIDVTGKAKDVLKRIEVAEPIAANAPSNQNLPFDTIEGQNICKRLETNVVGTTESTPSGYSASPDPCKFPYGSSSTVL